ncbi:MAG: pilus assembly protein [Chloroflexi bacterium]|nr:pilus assembly protein [Chloroflexota bacterium]
MKTKLTEQKRRMQSSKGQSLIEFELALIIMIFLMLGVSDFGLAFFSWISLRDAAQEGVTYASVSPPFNNNSVAAIRTRVKSASLAPINFNDISDDEIEVELLGSVPKPCPGYSVRVKVTYDYHMISPMISEFVGSPTIPVSASVTNTILQGANGYDCSGS